MNKAEAVKIVRNIYQTDKEKEALETLIPELKESEDERIRKEIRNFLIDMECKKEWISYLEKQKEQQPAEWSETEKARIDRIVDVLDWAESKGRISYSDWEDYVCYVNSLKPQPKQEWSEEDEVMLKEIISFFKDGSVKLQHDLDLYAGFLEKRFKSLRPQPNCKPSDKKF